MDDVKLLHDEEKGLGGAAGLELETKAASVKDDAEREAAKSETEQNKSLPPLPFFHMSQLGISHDILMRDRLVTRWLVIILLSLILYAEKKIRDKCFNANSVNVSLSLGSIGIFEIFFAVGKVYPFIYSVFLWRRTGKWPTKTITMTVLYAEWEGQYEDIPDETVEGLQQTNEELFEMDFWKFVVEMYRYMVSGAVVRDSVRYLRHRFIQGRQRRYALPPRPPEYSETSQGSLDMSEKSERVTCIEEQHRHYLDAAEKAKKEASDHESKKLWRYLDQGVRPEVTHVIVDNDLKYDDVVTFMKLNAWPENVVLVNEEYPIECIQFRALLESGQDHYAVKGKEPEVEQIYGVGLGQAWKWFYAGHRTLEDLKSRVQLMPNQEIVIDHYDHFNTRIPRDEMTALCDIVKKAAAEIDPDIEAIIGGSYRRGPPNSGDIDFILTKPDTCSSAELLPILNKLINHLTSTGFLVAALAIPGYRDKSGSKWHGACVHPDSDVWRRIDFLIVLETEFGAASLYFTGDDIFNRSMRLLSGKKGMRLNQRGLYRDVPRGPRRVKMTQGSLIEGADEKRIFDILQVPWRPPHHRICHRVGVV
ncbi:hypothetical protein G7Y89_g10255 [Cudoniella acicularis]|uniref:DNA polymerase n=1 Tax=Cudoniella acicularis TaxID=354080 RepID=A0A8H4REP9_9HELO|nr:hypothetical protein G7Y89_g10255 [Cudoniella acicularis]